MTKLNEEFSARLQDCIRQSHNLGYPPTRIEEMLTESSAVAVAKRLVVSGDIHKGLKEMAKLGRKDLTIEAIMLEERFQPLFDRSELDAATFRLAQV
jgi:hypothetical protein